MNMILPAWIKAGADLQPLPSFGSSSNVPVYIYGLCDPETDEIRYIGKSIRPVERLQNHMNERSNCHRSHWLQSLKSRGLMPTMVILEELIGEWPWQEAERYWIARGRRIGWRLTNNTSGGDGAPDLPPETRTRMAAVWKGRKHSPETTAKLRLMRKGIRHTDETKAKMSRAQRGRKILWADKIGEKVRKLTPEDVLAIKLAMASGVKGCDLAAQYGVHRTTISKVKMGTYPTAKAGVRGAEQDMLEPAEA